MELVHNGAWYSYYCTSNIFFTVKKSKQSNIICTPRQISYNVQMYYTQYGSDHVQQDIRRTLIKRMKA